MLENVSGEFMQSIWIAVGYNLKIFALKDSVDDTDQHLSKQLKETRSQMSGFAQL